MDLSVPETWIDLFIAGIGMLAGVVGIWLGLRYLSARAKDTPPEEVPATRPKPPQAPVSPPSPSPIPRPGPPPASSSPPQATWLQAEAVTLTSPGQMRLSLRNVGPSLLYERLQPGEFNELTVTYDPPIFREEERYAQGTSLTFNLAGPEPQRKTYHFQVFFQGLDGHHYRQEVAGVGQDPPILEAPVRL